MATAWHPAVHMRAMVRRDLPVVTAIEMVSYEFPWTQGIFVDCLREGYLCQVVCVGEVITGYGVLLIGVNEAHVLNICIDPHWRGQGLGYYLLQALLEVARRHRVQQVLLEVRLSNLVAHALYASLGFREQGRRARYYRTHHGYEEAIVMALELS